MGDTSTNSAGLLTTPAQAGSAPATAGAGAQDKGAAGAGGTGAQGAAAGAPPPAAGAGAQAGASGGKPADAGAGNAQQGGKEAKPADGAAGKPADGAALVDVELKLPEGVKADAKLLEGFKAFAKENGLKSESAQKVVDLFVASQQAQLEQQSQRWSEQVSQWAEAAKSDKEYGGEKFGASLEVAKKALNEFGSKELSSLLDDTGLTNHPEVIRLFHRVGKAIAEDRVAGSNGTGAAPGTGGDEALHRQLYPTMFKNKDS